MASGRLRFRFRFSSSSADRLNVDILLLILEKVSSVQDFVAFASVCKSWREAARLCLRIPWMVLPDDQNNRLLCGLRREESRTLTKSLHIPVEFKEDGCIGLNYGWILTVSRKGDLNLVHPLFRSQIELPRMDSNSISRAALSSDPSQTLDFVVMILLDGSESGYSECLSYTNLGDKRWTQIFNNDRLEMHESIQDGELVTAYSTVSMWADVTCYQDRLYAVDYKGRVWSSGLRDVDRSIALVAALRIRPSPRFDIYIVGFDDKLLVVVRSYQSHGLDAKESMERHRIPKFGPRWMRRFEVHKVDLIKGKHKRIRSLGNKAIFVGHNTATTIFESSGGLIKPNHIYYSTDDNYTAEVCLYSHRLEDGLSTALKVPMSLGTPETTPFWYMPSL